MNLRGEGRERGMMRVVDGVLGVVLVAGMSWGGVWAQATSSAPKATSAAAAAPAKTPEVAIPRPDGPLQPTQTFYIKNVNSAYDIESIRFALRSLLPSSALVVPVERQNAIFVSGTTEELALAQRIVNDLDRPTESALPVKTFYLKNIGPPNDANEILTALRNILPPDVKLYLLPSQNAIVLRGPAEAETLVQKLINELDRPKKSFRLTYTITEMDNGKRVGTPQHFAMIVADGHSVTLKQGSRVPIATGSAGPGVQTQFTYMDVGIDFEATLTSDAAGALLKSKVDQTAVADSPGTGDLHQPVVRHATLEGTSLLTLGKPLMLGSVDVPGSTRHLDVEAVIEALP